MRSLSVKKIVAGLSSPKAIAVVNGLTSLIALCQAIDMYMSGDEKRIGFRLKRNK